MTKPQSDRGLALVGTLLACGLLASCCIGGIVIGMRFLGEATDEKKPPREVAESKTEPPLEKKDGSENVEPTPKDGVTEPPAPPTPPQVEWPVVVRFDDRGIFTMTTDFEPRDPAGTSKGPAVARFRFAAKANTAYMVEAVDRPELDVLVEADNGTSGAAPADKSRPRHQRVLFEDTDGDYLATVTGDPQKVKQPFTLRIRAWDGNEPLPAAFQIPAPPAVLPKIEIAQNVPKTMLVGGAFAPNSKSFWLSSHDMTLSKWDHPAIVKKGSFKLKKRLYALAVDGKGRLYAQPGPADTGPPTFARRTLGDIVVYEDLDPKGDVDNLPPPARTFQINGLIGRMITSPDRRAVYFLDVHNQSLGRIDTEDGRIDRTLSGLSAGTRAFCLTPDGQRIYCCADTGHIDVIDALKFTLEKSVTLTRGQPYEIAATDGGIVFVLTPDPADEKTGRGICAMVNLSKPAADKAGVFPVPCNHHGQFLQIIPGQNAVLISGDRKVSVCVAPPRPALQKAQCVECAIRAGLAPGWIMLGPDGRTLLHDAGEILSIGK